MTRRNILLAGVGVVLAFVVAGMMYTSHFASIINQPDPYRARGSDSNRDACSINRSADISDCASPDYSIL
jgi:hypothetical protein